MAEDLAFMGAYFPPWMVAAILGGGLTVAAKLVLAWAGLGRHMRPRMLTDVSLLALMIMLSWLWLFRP